MRILNTHTEYIDPKNLFTKDEQIDQCCEPVSVSACADVGRVSVYEAAESKIDLDALKEKYQAKYPNIIINNVVLEDIGPDGPCGTMYETWEGRLNCCDEVESLAIDKEHSVEILTDHSSGFVVAVGGRLPLTVTVRGNGFYAENNLHERTTVVGSHLIPIYTADACGSAMVTVSDGCSEVGHMIRSTNGQWMPVTQDLEPMDLEALGFCQAGSNLSCCAIPPGVGHCTVVWPYDDSWMDSGTYQWRYISCAAGGLSPFKNGAATQVYRKDLISGATFLAVTEFQHYTSGVCPGGGTDAWSYMQSAIEVRKWEC